MDPATIHAMHAILVVTAGLLLQAIPLDVKADSSQATVQQLTYRQLDGTRNAATLVVPATAATAPRPAILFLHWYGPPNASSNRTQYLPDAVDLAGSGVVSL